MEYLTAKEVMEKFKVHRNTITNWMKNNGMPYYNWGNVKIQRTRSYPMV